MDGEKIQRIWGLCRKRLRGGCTTGIGQKFLKVWLENERQAVVMSEWVGLGHDHRQ